MNFEAYGPFEFNRDDIGKSTIEFWKGVEKREEGLSETIGCYVFGLKSNNKLTPWYVGKTLALRGFKGEVFTPHKLLHYHEVLRPSQSDKGFRRGTPFLTFFPAMTETGWFSGNRSTASAEIAWLEQIMIGMALVKNPEIANTSFTKYHRSTKVRGILGEGRGRPTLEAVDAYNLFY
jgi:hypothetical protein